MHTWSTSSKVSLAVAVCAVFTGVVVVAGRDIQAQPSRVPGDDGGAHVAAQPRSVVAAAAVPSSPEHETPGADEVPPSEAVPVAELSRLATPLDETTAEENEQRGDAIRSLGTSANPDAVAPLIHALRNDVDIRNRILALNGLLRAALAGNTSPAIVDALAEATRSDDDVIASQARQALVELDGSRRR